MTLKEEKIIRKNFDRKVCEKVEVRCNYIESFGNDYQYNF